MPRPLTRTFGFELLLLVSGFCGISYEILYARILSNFIGDQFAVSASVLMTFLAGIGLGSLYAHRLWRWLWLVEAAIGLCGVGFALGAGRVGPWVSAGAILHGGLGGAVLVCAGILCIPAFLIGCSLPLFGGYLERLGSAQAFHKAYRVYNIGAALTVLVVEFLLLRLLGIRTTVLTMAAFNGLTSIGLAAGFSDLRSARPDPPPPERIERSHLLALTLASVASAVFQLLMIKLAECVLGPFKETFALVVALVLLGIAAGSAAVERFRPDFARLLLLGLAGLVWIVGGFGLVGHAYAWFYALAAGGYLATVALKFGTLAVLMGIPAASFGATIPTLLLARGDVARDSGRLLFVSSMANGLGFLLMAFALHPYLDYGILLLVVSGLACASVLAYQRFRGWPALGAAALFVLAIALHRIGWDEKLLYLESSRFSSVASLEDARRKIGSIERFKGHQDVFSLVQNGDDVSFFVNGYVSVSLGSTTEPMVGALPAILAPRTDRALVLGLGSGMTAGAVGLLFDRTDAVEINPAVVENLWRMKRWNFDVGSMPSVRVVVDDGMHFMRASKETYSLIVNTVTTPLYFSAAKLYTREFFEEVRGRLAPDGLYVTWVDSRVGDRGLDIILRTLEGSFRECWLIALRSEYYLLVCSNEKIALRHPRLVVDNRTLAAYFFDEAGVPAEWLPYSLIHTRAFDLTGNRDVPLNTLDHPELEFEMALVEDARIDGFLRRLVAHLDEASVVAALEPGMRYDPMDHLLHLEMMMGSSAILDRWSAIVAPRFENFERENRKAMFDHLAGWAVFANTAAAHQEFGWFLGSIGRHEAAVAEYTKALALAPDSVISRLMLASAYVQIGDLDSAVRKYQAVLERYPGEPNACLGMGRVAKKRGRYEEALRFLTAAVSHYRQSANVHFDLGLVEEGLGRKDRAKKAFERAHELAPENKEIASALARLRGE